MCIHEHLRWLDAFNYTNCFFTKALIVAMNYTSMMKANMSITSTKVVNTHVDKIHDFNDQVKTLESMNTWAQNGGSQNACNSSVKCNCLFAHKNMA